MPDTTITSANSIFTIAALSLFPIPVALQGYATDKAFATEALELAETLMGVDGVMSAGYVPNPVKQTITLQADSPSKIVFDTIIEATKAQQDIFWLSGAIVLPSTGEVYVMSRGTITTVKQIPDAQKMLQPVDYVVTWQSIDKSLL
jgi:hypothetical protein